MGISLKDRVLSRLEALGINSFEAARRGGLGREFVHDILNDRKLTVKGTNLAKLAAALETSPDWLIAPYDVTDGGDGPSFRYLDNNKNVVNVAYSVSAQFVELSEAEGPMGEIYTGPNQLEGVALIGAAVADTSAEPAFPRGAQLLVARPDGPGGLAPTSGNPVLLKIVDPDGRVQITARRFERINGADVFLSLEDPAAQLPPVYAPDPRRDQWQVLGQIVAFGYWPEPKTDGEPLGSLGNLPPPPPH